jgi:hypothetical protein
MKDCNELNYENKFIYIEKYKSLWFCDTVLIAFLFCIAGIMLDLQIFIQTHKQRPQGYPKYIGASACQVQNDALDLLFLDKDGLK